MSKFSYMTVSLLHAITYHILTGPTHIEIIFCKIKYEFEQLLVNQFELEIF